MKIRLKINREEIVPKEKGILTGLLEYFGKGLEVANSQMVLTFEVTCHLTGPQGPEDIMTIWMNKEEAQELSDAGVPLLTVMAPRSMLQNRRGLTYDAPWQDIEELEEDQPPPPPISAA